jgi:hypothetical protein
LDLQGLPKIGCETGGNLLSDAGCVKALGAAAVPTLQNQMPRRQFVEDFGESST